MGKIGIDIQAAQGKTTGLGVYTKNLVEHLTAAAHPRMSFYFFGQETSNDLNTMRRMWRENVQLPLQAVRQKIDLLHVPAFAPPVFKASKLVVTVHDLIGMLFPNQQGWPSRFYWGKWLPWTIRRADVMIADSEHTKKDLLKHLRIPESKIHVIYPSGYEKFLPGKTDKMSGLKNRFGISGPYFLCVGTLEPRKNLQRVIEAFVSFKEKNRDFHLVIVGSKNFAHGKIFDSLSASAGTMRDIHFTHYVEHEELNTLYCGAQAFIYPSLYEGFGIPILEAMACGTPVITSDRSSIPEVAGSAAIQVNPYQVEEIEAAMHELTRNHQRRAELIEKGFLQIKKFSWKETAAQTLRVYESIL